MATGSLFPYGKSGLKSCALTRRLRVDCLFPYGKSGLKSPVLAVVAVGIGSLPVWEEWIEIATAVKEMTAPLSLPVWEEWIEIHTPVYV